MSVALPSADRHADLHEGARRVLPAFPVAIAVSVAFLSIVGLGLTHLFEHSWLVDLDQRIEHGLVDHRTAFFDRATGWTTLPADPVPVALVWAVSMLVLRRLAHRWRPALYVFFAVAGEKSSYFLTTLIVRRPRPDVLTIGTRHVTSSFPSGHVGSAVSLYGSLAVLVVLHMTSRSPLGKAVAATLVAALAAIVGVSRMYRGFHFLTDVLVGACVGASWLVISSRLVRRLDDPHDDASRGAPRASVKTSPPT